MSKKFISLFLAIIMMVTVIGPVPVTAFAEEAANPALKVYLDQTRQEIDGFNLSGAFRQADHLLNGFADSEEKQKEVLDLVFGLHTGTDPDTGEEVDPDAKGIGISIWRNMIGDETGPGEETGTGDNKKDLKGLGYYRWSAYGRWFDGAVASFKIGEGNSEALDGSNYRWWFDATDALKSDAWDYSTITNSSKRQTDNATVYVGGEKYQGWQVREGGPNGNRVFDRFDWPDPSETLGENVNEAIVSRYAAIEKASGTISEADAETVDELDAETADEEDAETADEEDVEISDEADVEIADEADAETADEEDAEIADEEDAETSDEADVETVDAADAETVDEADVETTDEADAETVSEAKIEAANNAENDENNETGLAPIDRGQVWAMKWAQEYAKARGEEMKFISAAWSGPAWLKSNGLTYGGVVPEDRWEDYANYLADYAQGYRDIYGIPIYGISLSNEPNATTGGNGAYSACHWSVDNYEKFVREYLGPIFKERGLLGDGTNGTTKLQLGDEMNWNARYIKPFWTNANWAEEWGEENWGNSVDYITHTYAANTTSGVKATNSDLLEMTLRAQMDGNSIWNSEISTMSSQNFTVYDYTTGGTRTQSGRTSRSDMGSAIGWSLMWMRELSVAQKNAVGQWWAWGGKKPESTWPGNTFDNSLENLIYIAQNSNGTNGNPTGGILGSDTDEYTFDYRVHKVFWSLGHFSKFVRPGWYRVNSEQDVITAPTNQNFLNVSSSSFVSPTPNDDGSYDFSVVVINGMTTDQTLDISFPGYEVESLTRWETREDVGTDNAAPTASNDTPSYSGTTDGNNMVNKGTVDGWNNTTAPAVTVPFVSLTTFVGKAKPIEGYGADATQSIPAYSYNTLEGTATFNNNTLMTDPRVDLVRAPSTTGAGFTSAGAHATLTYNNLDLGAGSKYLLINVGGANVTSGDEWVNVDSGSLPVKVYIGGELAADTTIVSATTAANRAVELNKAYSGVQDVTIELGSDDNAIRTRINSLRFTNDTSLPVVTITAQPVEALEFIQGEVDGALTVGATVDKGAALTYQWYRNTEYSNVGGTAVSGETSATFAIPANLRASGSPYYYYCEVSATGDALPVYTEVSIVIVDPVPGTTDPTDGLIYDLQQDIGDIAVGTVINPGSGAHAGIVDFTKAGSPVFTVKENKEGGKSIEVSGRTANWNGLDFRLTYLELEPDIEYTFTVTGSVAGTASGNMTIAGANGLSGTYATQSITAGNRDYNLTYKRTFTAAEVAAYPTMQDEYGPSALYRIAFSDGNTTYTIDSLTVAGPETEPKSVSVGAQSGGLPAGAAGTVTFPVETAGIENGEYAAQVINLPTGVSVQGPVTIANNTGTLTLAGNTETVQGITANLRLIIDNTPSAAFTLNIGESEEEALWKRADLSEIKAGKKYVIVSEAYGAALTNQTSNGVITGEGVPTGAAASGGLASTPVAIDTSNYVITSKVTSDMIWTFGQGLTSPGSDDTDSLGHFTVSNDSPTTGERSGSYPLARGDINLAGDALNNRRTAVLSTATTQSDNSRVSWCVYSLPEPGAVAMLLYDHAAANGADYRFTLYTGDNGFGAVGLELSTAPTAEQLKELTDDSTLWLYELTDETGPTLPEGVLYKGDLNFSAATVNGINVGGANEITLQLNSSAAVTGAKILVEAVRYIPAYNSTGMPKGTGIKGGTTLVTNEIGNYFDHYEAKPYLAAEETLNLVEGSGTYTIRLNQILDQTLPTTISIILPEESTATVKLDENELKVAKNVPGIDYEALVGLEPSAANAANNLVNVVPNEIRNEADAVEFSLAEKYKDYFLIGNTNSGGSTTEWARKHFNTYTANNEHKPEALMNGQGNFNFDGIASKTLIETAIANDSEMIGHVLVWHDQSQNNHQPGIGATREEALERMETYIQAVVENFDQYVFPENSSRAGEKVFRAWDVVNEAFINEIPYVSQADINTPGSWKKYLRNSAQEVSGWENAPGSGTGHLGGKASRYHWFDAFENGANADAGESGADFIYWGFVFARRYTDAELIYNDFNIYEEGKAQMVAQMVTELNARYAEEQPNGADPRQLIDVVGMQGHWYLQDTPARDSQRGVQRALEILREADVRVHITELDLFVTFPNDGSWGGNTVLKNRTGTALDNQPGAEPYWRQRFGLPTDQNISDSLHFGKYMEAVQAEVYAEYFAVLMENADIIDRVTFWGLRDTNSWRRYMAPTLWYGDVNGQANPKLSYYAVADPEEFLGVDTIPAPKTSVNRVRVSQADTSPLETGGTRSFAATVYGNGSPAQTVTWTVEGGVSGTSITSAGILQVASNETATKLTVRATSTEDPSVSGTVVVDVVVGEPVPVESINLNAGSLNMLSIGKTLELSPTILPENATDKTVTYTSNNPNVASVDENGVVTAHKTGTAMITATASSGKVSKTTVRVTY